LANPGTTPRSRLGWTSFLSQQALTALLFAAVFCVVQRLTFALRFPPFERTTIWTPGALIFAALLLTPPRRWWVCFVGLCVGVFAAYYDDRAIPLPTAMLTAPVVFGTIALGAWGLRRFRGNSPFGSLTALLVFMVIAIVVIPVISTAPIELTRFAAGADDIWPMALRSVLCIALGLLIATPALTLTLKNGLAWVRVGTWQRYVEIVALTVSLATVGWVCYEGPAGTTASPALLFAPLPLLLWAAARFELAGVCWAILLLALQSTWGAIQGRGPFTSRDPAENVLQLQLFLLCITLPLMSLAAVIQERRVAFLSLVQSEQEARREHAQLATIYNSAPVGLGFVDAHLRYVSVNDCLAEMNGLPAADHVGRTVRQVLPRRADAVEPQYRRVIETGQPVIDLEFQDLGPAQSRASRTWLVSRFPVKDLDGVILGVNTVAVEITERKRMEERFRLVVESTPSAIIMANADGQIVLVNAQTEKFFGYRREELVGHAVELLVPERFRDEHPDHRAAFFASPSARPMGAGHDLFGRRKDGSEFPIEIGLTPIQTGEGLVILSVIVDITERKRAEEVRQELFHASRLAIAGELTASIAHEINQPLGAILSNADAAEMLLDNEPLPLDELRQILEDIRNDDLRASEVIKRLRGLLLRRKLEMQPLDLNEVISEVLNLIRAETVRRGVVLKTNLAAELPLIRGDRVHLQQILLNLFLNGMEAMADTPRPKKLLVHTTVRDDEFAEIAVADGGTGIPPARLPRLFEAFFSTKKDGMGLGLSIVRSLVEAHGGQIWAENNPTGGATFRFTVPAGGKEAVKESSDRSRSPVEMIT
jgi:two-component system sensor kinase FixL